MHSGQSIAYPLYTFCIDIDSSKQRFEDFDEEISEETNTSDIKVMSHFFQDVHCFFLYFFQANTCFWGNLKYAYAKKYKHLYNIQWTIHI